MKYDSPNFKNGKFHNLSYTPKLAEGYNFFDVLKDMLFKKVPHRIPADPIPAKKTNLKSLDLEEDVIVWFGHSSYFLQIAQKRFLIDPVFSGNASPVPGMIKAFKGTTVYSPTDMPEIDYLIISHDHYDHLDSKTIRQLKPKVKHVICGLGVGAHFRKWDYNKDIVFEKDWYDSVRLDDNLNLHILPARHFSGRGLVRNNTLWCSFLLQSPNLKLYLGGDSGYGKHFAEIGKEFKNIDLAILENGQYNEPWHDIHMFPEETLQAAEDLKTKRLFPVHSSKFALSQHSWKKPLTEISRLNKKVKIPLVTPTIGEKVNLRDEDQKFESWWDRVD